MNAARLDVRALLRDIGRFGRFSVLGFSLMLPLIGAAAVSSDVSVWQLAAFAAVGLAFHIFVYVSNDVFDLPIDRTQPLRAGSPLVRGLIRPSVALAIALIPVPVACIIHLWVGGPPAASAALVVAMGFGLLYNLYGKRIPFPLLSDAIQGVAWVALALFGALATDLPLREPVAWLGATIFVYVLLINALHGGLRDLENDTRHDAQTTALYLGARVTPDGRLIVPASVVLYGLALQIVLLLLAVFCVVRNWPEENRIPYQVMVAAIAGAHLVLLWLARAALRDTGNKSEMIRAGIYHLFLSLGVVCLPFAFFTNTPATIVIVASYAVPLMILSLYLVWNSMKTRSRLSVKETQGIVAFLCVLTLVASPAQADSAVFVVSREEIIRAMKAERDKGYNLLATANGARFNAAVILDIARSAGERDPLRTPIVLDHRHYYEAFLQVAEVSPSKAPTFIKIAHEHHEDQYVDYRRENVIKEIVRGRQPEFALNVVAGWTGAPSRYSYEDHVSEPPLRASHERITSYRLLDFGDMILFDNIQGISGRALGGLLGLVFRLIGDAQAVRSFITIAPNERQVTLTTGRKGPITVTTTATVDRTGRGEKGLPPGQPDLVAIEERLKKPFEAKYVPIRRTDPFRWRRVDQTAEPE